MASRAASEAALLPIHLLSLALRPCFYHSSAAAPRWARAAAALLAVAALVSAIRAVPDAGTRPVVSTGPGSDADADADALRSEIKMLRLKVAQLGNIAFSLECCSFTTRVATVVSIRISRGLYNCFGGTHVNGL
jgi:hypothetical protein